MDDVYKKLDELKKQLEAKGLFECRAWFAYGWISTGKAAIRIEYRTGSPSGKYTGFTVMKDCAVDGKDIFAVACDMIGKIEEDTRQREIQDLKEKMADLCLTSDEKRELGVWI